MSDRNETLRQFFGGYFHQDWNLDGAGSWQDVVRQFVKENPVSRVLAVRDALRSWLKETEASPLQSLPAAFACDYSPRSDGFTDREWVEQIADFLVSQVGHVGGP